jgi:hypothetical protein
MNLNEFKSSALEGGGARANLFEVQGSIGGANADRDLSFLCKSASLPPSDIGEIVVPWRGRQFKMPGDKTFGDWEITIISDAAWRLRGNFEAWMNQFNSHATNVSKVKGIVPNLFQDWTMRLLDREGNKLREYTLVGCWPKSVGEIAMAMDSNDSLAEFSVTMTYQWWESPSTN